MKKIKKCMALILAMMMALAMSMTAFAEEEGAVEKEAAQEAVVQTGSLTVNAKSGQNLKGQNITIFKLFDFEIDENSTENKPSGTYTVNKTYEKTLINVLNMQEPLKDSSYEIYTAILKLEKEGIQNFANSFTAELGKTALETEKTDYFKSGELGENNSYTFSDLPYGYYLVYLGGSTEIMSSLQLVAGEANINLKSETPVPDKEAYDPESGNPIGSVQIGDVIEYKVTTKLPDISAYKNYQFILHDTLSNGLDFATKEGNIVESGKLSVEVTLKEGSAAESIEAEIDGRKMDLDLSEFVKNHQTDKGKIITVSYYAKVNEKADIDNTQNEAKLEYSNDPTSEGTGESIPDVVKTPTFALNVHKYEKGKETEYLANATFKLSTDEKGSDVIKVKATGKPGKYVVAESKDVDAVEEMTTIADSVAANELYNLQINGLKEGTYYLVETSAPQDYSKAPAVKVTIKKIEDDVNLDYEIQDENGTPLENKIVKIENRKEGMLPETGGIGTVLFTLAGAILLAGIVISFIVSRKRSAE